MPHFIVTYANSANAAFDFDYYVDTHLSLGEQLLKPFGLLRAEVDKGLKNPRGESPSYVCVTRLYFSDTERMYAGFAEHGDVLRQDIENYTNITPVFTLVEELTATNAR